MCELEYSLVLCVGLCSVWFVFHSLLILECEELQV